MKKITFKPEDYISVGQAAKSLGVSRQTIYNWISEGFLEGTNIANKVCVLSSDVDRLKAKQTS